MLRRLFSQYHPASRPSYARISALLGHFPTETALKTAFILGHLKNKLTQAITPAARQRAMIDAWNAIRTLVLQPGDTLETKRQLFNQCYAAWDEAHWGKPPVWEVTDPLRLKQSNTQALMTALSVTDYDDLYQLSIDQGKVFWHALTQRLGIRFKNATLPHADKLVDASNPENPRWFPGLKLNIVDSMLAAPSDHIALVYRREGTQQTVIMTYGELHLASNRVACALLQSGFKKGNHIAIDMPMNKESVVIFLGILKMGGTLVSLADSFKAADIALRLQQIPAGVKAIFTQDFTGKNPLYEVIKRTPHAPTAIVLTTPNQSLPVLRPGDLHYEPWLLSCTLPYATFDSVAMDPDDNLNIIFSSSTSTGKEKAGEAPKAPKAIPWQAHTFIKSAADAHLHHDMQAHKTLCWPTNLGWMMGSFAIAAALMNGGRLALYDGSPLTREFGVFVRDVKVTILGLVPALAERWEKTGCMEGLDWSSIERFSSTGSPSMPANYFYLMALVPQFAPVIEYMGGTEIGGGYITNTEFRAFSPSLFNTPTLGTPLHIATKESAELQKGEVCFPLLNGKGQTPPMGLSSALLNGDHHQKYFEGELQDEQGQRLRRHGDILQVGPHQQFQSGGRADDGIKINAIKTSSTELEAYIKTAKIAAVKDVVITAVRSKDSQGGEGKVVAFVVVDPAVKFTSSSLREQCEQAIKQHNPQLAKLHAVEIIAAVPVTASNKIKRQWLSDHYLENHPGLFPDGGHDRKLKAKL